MTDITALAVYSSLFAGGVILATASALIYDRLMRNRAASRYRELLERSARKSERYKTSRSPE